MMVKSSMKCEDAPFVLYTSKQYDDIFRYFYIGLICFIRNNNVLLYKAFLYCVIKETSHKHM